MDESDISNLDTEFKRYLQIMRPYLGLLEDQELIDICNAWIQRLSKCKKKEKYLRNKYVFSLCFQLAKGAFEEPFNQYPTNESLPSINDDINSDTSSEVEYVVINADEESTKVIYHDKNTVSDSECNSQSVDLNEHNKDRSCTRKREIHIPNETSVYTCSGLIKNKTNNEVIEDDYKNRTNNLIMKLREIKLENERLHGEIEELKGESKVRQGSFGSVTNIVRVDKTTSASSNLYSSSSTILSLKLELQEVQDSRNVLIETIKHLQEKIEALNESKKTELAEIKSTHNIEIANCKKEITNELTQSYEKKLGEQKTFYENKIKDLQDIIDMNKCGFDAQKNVITAEKEKILNEKNEEIARLKKSLEEEKNNMHSLLTKLSEQSKESGDNSSEVQKLKIEQLEKRLYKVEKSKSKCIRMYEAKLANLQREKHLAECSLQLQLVRQRAQIITEATDENQLELTTTLDKLETKYKEIVANVQSTAIQRRVQDQITLDSVVQATIKTENMLSNSRGTNRSQFSGRTMQNHSREENGFDCDISSLMRGNKVGNVIVGNKSFGEESVTGYCLDGERMGQLFERVYIPQRDTGDGHLKK